MAVVSFTGSSFLFLKVSFQIIFGNKVFPVDRAGLGGGGASSVSSRLQHVELAHSPQTPQLPSSRLQLQPQASQDPHH